MKIKISKPKTSNSRLELTCFGFLNRFAENDNNTWPHSNAAAWKLKNLALAPAGSWISHNYQVPRIFVKLTPASAIPRGAGVSGCGAGF